METFGLYIHIPFCVRKCLYCDFLSFPLTDGADSLSPYIDALIAEMHDRKEMVRHRTVSSIFIGGGTPSLLTSELIRKLMSSVYTVFDVSENAEITMECNPGTLNEDKLNALKDCGVNRLSIGLQSANDAELSCLGRIHSFDMFLENYKLARDIGFNNINIDLMSALPGQTVESYEKTLRQVLALKPEHISAYSLIIEDGTPFGTYYDPDTHKVVDQTFFHAPLPSEEDERLMYTMTEDLLKTEGYDRYEISNYALPGHACRHNCIYWTRGDYLGLGLGSASMIDNQRFSNISCLEDYISLWPGTSAPSANASSPTGTKDFERLSRQAQMEEFMFLGLRLTAGIDTAEFRHQFDTDIETIFGDAIQKHLSDGTLIKNGNQLYLSKHGLDVANYVMSDFLLE